MSPCSAWRAEDASVDTTCSLDSAGGLNVDLGFRLDPLSLTFVMLMTFVGTLIHVYSVAYMDHDPTGAGSSRYLNLFVAAMLIAGARRLATCCCSSAGRAWVSRPTC